MATRQQLHQQRLRAQGLCVMCGTPSAGFSRCPACREKEAARRRDRGQKTWTKGSPGRPPKAVLESLLANVDWSMADNLIAIQTGLTTRTITQHRRNRNYAAPATDA